MTHKTTHNLGKGWKAQFTTDGGMIVFDTNDVQQIIVPPESMERLKNILNRVSA